MAIPVDDTPNISLDMKEFTDKTPVHYDEMNSRHKQHLDNEKALLYPAFNDSGNVSGISSFNDFLGTIKSRMRLFDFFRNFKAGMQFVMHLGRAANNCTTTSEGLYLDARQGKVLMDLYTKLNSDLASKGAVTITFLSSSSLTLIKHLGIVFLTFSYNSADMPNIYSYSSADLPVQIPDEYRPAYNVEFIDPVYDSEKQEGGYIYVRPNGTMGIGTRYNPLVPNIGHIYASSCYRAK